MFIGALFTIDKTLKVSVDVCTNKENVIHTHTHPHTHTHTQRNTAAAAAKPLQSCPTLCDPIDGSPPGSAVPGILQARTLEWVAITALKKEILPFATT